jgi:hypothetical protein
MALQWLALDHDICRAGDEVVGLEQAIHRGLGDEVLLLVGEAHGELAGREFGLLQGERDHLGPDFVGDAVPHSTR